jgi:hypothetical protein
MVKHRNKKSLWWKVNIDVAGEGKRYMFQKKGNRREFNFSDQNL